MVLHSLESAFPDPTQRVLAESVLDYFRYQQKFSTNPIPYGHTLFAYFKCDWNDLVDEGRIQLSSVSAGTRVRCEDVERRLPDILSRLCMTNFLQQVGQAYKLSDS